MMNSKSPVCDASLSFTNNDAKKLAVQLKALAHPVRIQILQHLGKWSQCCCNDFCACIPLAQSTISQHLKILNQAGIIKLKTSGNCSHYSLNPDALELVSQAITQLQHAANPLKLERNTDD